MKPGKIIAGTAACALLLSAIPYRFRKDEESGTLEIRSLLWAIRKTPHKEGESKDHYSFAIPPSGLDCDPTEQSESSEAPSAEA